MDNDKILKVLRSALENTTPDVFEQVAAAPVRRMERMDHITAQTDARPARVPFFKAFMAAAAPVMFVLLIVVGGWWQFLKIDSRVDVDINPSVEILVNRDMRVVGLQPLNRDAVDVIRGIGYKQIKLDYVMNAVMGSLYNHGYLEEAEKAILISVENPSEATAEKIRTQLEKEVSSLYIMSDKQVVSQIIVDKSTQERAQELGISIGKMALIDEVMSKHPEYKLLALLKLSVGELLEILN